MRWCGVRGQLSTHDDYEAKGRKDIGRDRCDTRLQPRTIRLTGSSSEVRPGLKVESPTRPRGSPLHWRSPQAHSAPIRKWRSGAKT